MDTALRLPLLLAALSGALAVAAGAFGAHGATGEAKAWLQTGGMYQLVHAMAAVGAALLARNGAPAAVWAAWLFVLGALVFSGALYGLALGGPRVLGAVAPLGGLTLIAGWLTLAWAAFAGLRGS